MSALTDLFTAMANKIRSKTGTATTYTPSEMVSDGIDDVYDAGVASATTPITPSNSSPASMTANTGYKPTTNGYAIASYDSVTPSSTPESVASGDIVKIGGSGVIVDAIPTPTSITPSNSSPVSLTANTAVKPTTSGYAIASYDSVTPSSTQTAVSSGDIVKIGGSGVIVDTVPPTPTSITPSNSNPVPMYANTAYEPTVNGIAIADFINAVPSNSSPQSLVSGNIYKSQGNGYGIESYSSITPSNSSPVSLSSGSFYKPSASGYAISSYSSKTPSDTSPASVSSGAIIKASSAGYLYKTLQTLTETTLWTNSSPTSSFASQTVTLSQSSANFTYIKVYFRCSTSDSTTYDSGLIDIADYDVSTGSSSAPRFAMSMAMTNAYIRLFNKSTNTALIFGNARQWSQSANANTYCVPTKVVGVK